MNKEQLETKYKKAEQLAKKLGATRLYTRYNDFHAEFGKNFYGKVSVDAGTDYGYNVEVGGASFKFSNKREITTFTKNLQNAMKVYDILKR